MPVSKFNRNFLLKINYSKINNATSDDGLMRHQLRQKSGSSELYPLERALKDYHPFAENLIQRKINVIQSAFLNDRD